MTARLPRKRWVAPILGAFTAIACVGAAAQVQLEGGSRSIARTEPAAVARKVETKPETPATAQRRVALVIGNAAYQSAGLLANPVNDANDVCAVLRNLDFDADCHFDLPDRTAFRRALRTFASKLGPDTMAAFYFAGHGVQLRGDNYLLPVKIAPASEADLEDESVALSHVLRLLEEARSAPNLIILDACRDNPFAKPGALVRNPGLARVDPPVGSLLVYATAPGAEALDGGDGRNGLFTKHLLAHLRHPSVPLSEMLQQVASDVEREAREKFKFQQVPYRSFSYSGSLCLADCDDARASAQLAELKRRSEQAFERMRELEAENLRLSQATGARQKPLNPATPGHDKELGELRTLLLSYQQRIDVLERDAAERLRARSQARTPTAESRPRPVVVPSF
ncbi:caspase domain-containing protein [Inhella sp.]|uniref:caspase family protein n=1 Tax=Inhella sp. TaxID=1921806 RepID=UPI0035B3F956